jgi:acetylornithine deacetylase/succinyl-diaminopimelate desuccinylase-like protein
MNSSWSARCISIGASRPLTGRPPLRDGGGDRALWDNASACGGLAREIVIFGPGSIDQAHRDIEWIDLAELEKVAGIVRRSK